MAMKDHGECGSSGRGRGHGRWPAPTYEIRLTLVGAGTPMGELLRCFWRPIGLAQDTMETPKKVCVLGEHLILFRDGDGRPGLLYPRCAHRGTTLYYGRVEERGLRCCFHGWPVYLPSIRFFAQDGHSVVIFLNVRLGRDLRVSQCPLWHLGAKLLIYLKWANFIIYACRIIGSVVRVKADRISAKADVAYR